MKKVLLIDDEKNFHYSFKRVFSDIDVISCYSAFEANKVIEKEDIALIILDIKMPGKSGLELLDEIRKVNKDIPVIIITAHGDFQTAIESMQKGATDYLLKPFDFEELKKVVYSKLNEIGDKKSKTVFDLKEYSIIGKSIPMQEVYKKIAKVVNKDINVLITGESGVGKERVAKSIHYYSNRRDKPFVAVNCGAIPENLLESEFFGYKKGAFTGAYADTKGKFLLADGGTLFLDEIGELPQTLQVKILRVLQESEITPIGSEKTIKINVRIIAATNKDLEKEVEKGNFREDLYYRLSVFPIHIPPLRERKEDIPEIVDYIIQNLKNEKKININNITNKAIQKLMAYDFPGNIRELENIIIHAAINSYNGYIDENNISFLNQNKESIDIENILESLYLKNVKLTDYFENEILKFLIKKMNNNQTKIAEYLNINRNTLRSKLKKYNLI